MTNKSSKKGPHCKFSNELPGWVRFCHNISVTSLPFFKRSLITVHNYLVIDNSSTLPSSSISPSYNFMIMFILQSWWLPKLSVALRKHQWLLRGASSIWPVEILCSVLGSMWHLFIHSNLINNRACVFPHDIFFSYEVDHQSTPLFCSCSCPSLSQFFLTHQWNANPPLV